MNSENQIADPASFGLLGLGIITFLVGVYQVGLMQNWTLVLPWAIMLGGGTQLIAGIMDFKRNNIFGATAFSAYGVFWISISIMWSLELLAANVTFINQLPIDAMALGWASIGWLVFTVYMTFGALKTSKILAVIFILIDLVFITLIAHFFAEIPTYVPGIAHLLLSASAFYGSAAVVLNTQSGKTIVPVGEAIIK